MRRIIFVILNLIFTVSFAQMNSQRGIVITEKGDTLRGLLDLRTSLQNCKQCVFKADGTDTYVTYKPYDIRSYRFDKTGKYYVSFTLKTESKDVKCFAEYLVKGMADLYYYSGDYDDYYVFVNEQNEQGVYVDNGFGNNSSQHEFAGRAKSIMSVLRKSPSAIKKVSMDNMDKSGFMEMAKQYHADVCTSNDDCIEYEYDKNSDVAKCHFRIYAGYQSLWGYMWKPTDFNSVDGCSSIVFGGGIDVDLSRTLKGLMFQADVMYYNVRKEMFILHKNYGVQKNDLLGVTAGIGYRMASHGVTPILRGGVLTTALLSGDLNTYSCGSIGFGVYGGVGVEIPVGKNAVVVSADYRQSVIVCLYGSVGATVGFRF